MPLRAAWAKPQSSTRPSLSLTRTIWASQWLTGCSPCGTIRTLPSWSASERWAASSRTDGAGRGSTNRRLLRRASADLSWPCDAPLSFSTPHHVLSCFINSFTCHPFSSLLNLCFKQNQNISAQGSLKEKFDVSAFLNKQKYCALAESSTSGPFVFNRSYCRSTFCRLASF